MKRIGIDALPVLANLSQGTGISKYITSLLRQLLSLDQVNAYTLFNRRPRRVSSPSVARSSGFHGPRVSFRDIPLPDRLVNWLSGDAGGGFGESLFFSGLDVFVSTCYFTPRLRKSRVASFVYDLSPLTTQAFSARYHENFRRLVKTTIERSSVLLTISESSRKDLIEHFALDSERIEIIYPGLDERLKPASPAEVQWALGRHGIVGEYILYVGIRGKHKNVTALARVFARLKRERRLPHKLVFCGRKVLSSNEVEREIRSIIGQNSLHNEIVFTGYVQDAELPALYSGASVFVYPSLYEGFGLPPLEAMACGAPVAVSKTSSLPEVVGEAGLTFDPTNDEDMFQNLLSILENPELREEMRTRGLRQAARFSLERSARRLRAVLEEIE